MLLKSRHTLAVIALALGFATYGCSDDEEKVEEPVTPTATTEAPPPDATAGASTFAPETVYFAFDDYTLNMDAQGRLQGMADHLKNAQTAVVQIEGHCDERGSIEYNLALGERRAQSVKNYLTQLGVDGARLSTISYGKELPLCQDESDACWGRNRRVHGVILK